jgi:hypothetical protein
MLPKEPAHHPALHKLDQQQQIAACSHDEKCKESGGYRGEARERIAVKPENSAECCELVG